MSTTTDDNLGHKGEIYCEEYNKGLRTLARKYACCYMDVYAMWQDARNGQDYMSAYDPGRPNELIHPGPPFKVLIASATYDLLFPTYYRGGDILDLGQSGRLFTALPAAYRLGITHEYVEQPNGWPIYGFLVTHRMSTGMYRQELTSFGSADKKVYVRVGWGASGWQSFYTLEPIPEQQFFNKSFAGTTFDKPYTFWPEGMTMEYVAAADGWPGNGMLATMKTNGVFQQTLTCMSSPVVQYVRCSYAGTGTFKQATLT
jgi:hypothetical protein